MQFITTIYTIGAAQGFILAVALWKITANLNSNRVLSAWLFLLVFDLVSKILFINDKTSPLIGSAFIFSSFFPFLYGSFFYLYVRTLTTNRLLKLFDLAHFIAFFIFIGLNMSVVIEPSLIKTNGLIYSDFILFPYSVTYVVAGLLLVIKYRNTLKQQKVDIDGIDLKWLIVMSYSQVIIWLIALSQSILHVDNLNSWSIYIAVSVWITLMGYLSLSQQDLPVLKSILLPIEQQTDERFEDVEVRLNVLIYDKKIHLQPSLTIGNLAKATGYPEYLISLFINRVHKMNFRDYINKLRIEEAKKILSDPKNKSTILKIAYDCGYNSKSTFNSAFKKITAQTPSAFRQKQSATLVAVDKL